MPTIVDSLVVLLDLDVSGFEKGFKKAEKKTGELKKGASSLKDSFGAVRKGIGEVASEVTKFLAEITGLSAAVGMLSKNIDVSATDILAWGNAAEKFGGSAGGIENAMKSISMSITDLQMTGESGMLQYFQKLNVSLVDAKGEAREADDILLQIADGLQQFDRPTAYNIAKKMGFDEGTVNLLLEGRQEIEKTLEQQKKLAEINARFAETSQELKDRWLDFGTALQGVGIDVLEVIQPALIWFFDVINQGIAWLHENKGIAFGIFSALAFVIGSVLVSSLVSATAAAWGFAAAMLSSLASATAAAWGFATAMLANPITWIVAAVLALIAAIGLLVEDYHVWAQGGKSAFDWTWFKSVIDVVTNAFEWLKNTVANVIGMVRDNMEPVMNRIMSVLSAVGSVVVWLAGMVLTLVSSWGKWVFETGKKIGTTVLQAFVDQLRNAYEWIGNVIRKWREWLNEKVVKPVVEKVKEAVEPVVEHIQEKAAPVVEKVKEAVEPIVEDIREKAVFAGGKIKEAVEPVVEDIHENAVFAGEKIKEAVEPVLRYVQGNLACTGEKAKEAAKPVVSAVKRGAEIVGDMQIQTVYAGKNLVDRIFKRAEGDYDSVNLGEKNGYKASKRPLEQMTVTEVMAAQQRREFNAAGRYQIIRTTMKEAVDAMGLTGNEKFDRKLQDRIFREYLIKEKRKEIWAYISGKSDDIKSAMIAMSKEWASFADPRTGRSYYDKDGVNKASVTPAQSQQLLMQMRESHMKNQAIYNNIGNRGPFRMSTRIDSINVSTNAEDGHKIAREIRREINSNPLVDQANMGLA